MDGIIAFCPKNIVAKRLLISQNSPQMNTDKWDLNGLKNDVW